MTQHGAPDPHASPAGRQRDRPVLQLVPHPGQDQPGISLPHGVVTFLYTDIEGSTSLWQRYPEIMPRMLEQHDALLNATISRHGGIVFRTMGDAFCAVFVHPPDALAAALAAQRLLRAQEWEEGCVLKVRMAILTGEAEIGGGDYVGHTLNRVARLLSAGHGGQVLVGGTTHDLAQGQLPEEIELRDLGERRLKDLLSPEQIFQLAAPDLRQDFPPLKTLDALPTNLPVQPTTFVGRTQELAEVEGMLRQGARLLTLTGPGGTGKTRLATEAAARVLDAFPDGVSFVALASLADPALVISTIASTLGVKEEGSTPLLETLITYLQSRRCLLLLDNLEHLLEAAPQIAQLLASCPRLTILVTSRTILHLMAEREYPVPSLTLPDAQHLPDLGTLAQVEAVAFFLDRARAVKPSFRLTADNAQDVVAICVRLDGLPLAIELAAARLRLFPLQALHQRLSSRLTLLTGGARDLPTRQQTLRGTIDWSYRLLEEAERALFARLSVFAGGCTIEAAEAVCNGTGDLAMDIIEGLTSLVEKSLLRQEGEEEPRFSMLETIREYAREQLNGTVCASDIEHRHAAYFLRLSQEAERALMGATQQAWLDRLDAEHADLRTALSWSVQHGDPSLGLSLMAATYRFWWLRGHLSEGLSWLEVLLADRSQVDEAVLAGAFFTLSWLAFHHADHARAEAAARESVQLGELVGDRILTSNALSALGNIAMARNDLDTAIGYHERVLSIRRELNDQRGIAGSLGNLGQGALRLGQPDKAGRLFTEALPFARASGDIWTVGALVCQIGSALEAEGRSEEALLQYREALEVLHPLGETYYSLKSLEGIGRIAAGAGRFEQAATLYSAIERLREQFGTPTQPVDLEAHQQTVALAREQLDPKTWQRAWDRGSAMSLTEAVRHALEANSVPG